ncbi:recombination protein RecR [Candidatus Aerophobetes bacterium]|nr:recombination protein RecR [Candidatus Aerophobetes bacterium]
MYYINSLDRLINQLTRLPGIGERSARRLAFYILKQPQQEAARLVDAIKTVKERVKRCSICNNFSEEDPCPICRDEKRNRSVICVVEEPQDVFLFERIREYQGLYHVLGGAISPLKGINPESLNINSLLKRVENGGVKEVILATDPDTEGEATAIYLFKLLQSLRVKVSRLAHGLPAGGDLEFADEITLTHALRGRKEMEEEWEI